MCELFTVIALIVAGVLAWKTREAWLPWVTGKS